MVILFRPVPTVNRPQSLGRRWDEHFITKTLGKQRHRDYIGLWRFENETPDFKRQEWHFVFIFKIHVLCCCREFSGSNQIWRIVLRYFNLLWSHTLQKFRIIFITFLNSRLWSTWLKRKKIACILICDIWQYSRNNVHCSYMFQISADQFPAKKSKSCSFESSEREIAIYNNWK